MRFGVVIPRYGVSYEEARSFALEAERLGYDSIWVTDHLQPTRGGTVLESWTLLSALAEATEKIRLGTVVLCYSYRHPSVLAKMASTLDRISNGRLELGLGTGSKPQFREHRALGIPYPEKFQERLNQFRDYIKVLRTLWKRDGRVSLSSQYYPLREASLDSPPIQEEIPIWIGARSRKMLRFVAELDVGWNFYGSTIEEYREAVELIERERKKLGKPPIEKSVFTTLNLWDEKRSLKIDEIKKLEESFTLLYGTPEEVIERVKILSELGVEILIFRDLNPAQRNIKRFIREVAPSI